MALPIHNRADVQALPALPRPTRVLMTTPAHFEVVYVINPHMEGHVGQTDPERARAEWEDVKAAYERTGCDVSVLDGAEGLPDMVFCANQTLPYVTPEGERGVVLSRMFAAQRRPEVRHYEAFFRANGYTTRALADAVPGTFEGMGDAIWHPGRALLWGGWGYRTDRAAYDHLTEALGVPAVPLHLTDPDFYHLDTCFCPLDEETVLLYPGAFRDDDLALIRRAFPRVIEAPEDEARGLFACNAHSPDGRHVIIQRGCTETNRRLEAAGYVPIEVETSEFLKSGGSVFCMKVMFW